MANIDALIGKEPSVFHFEKRMVEFYQNSECRSYEVTLKAGCRGYGMSGVMGSAGAYDVGARMWPQLIGCALAQEPGVLNFGPIGTGRDDEMVPGAGVGGHCGSVGLNRIFV